jgi:AcrR family transcriptional regulator
MTRRRTLTDDEILRRARTIFVERGYAARTRQIAAAVGLTWGAIALRFSSKRELFRQSMATDLHGRADADCRQAAAGDLPGLLERLRSHLWEQWPLRLHYRLAMPAADADGEADGLLGRLTDALEAHARGGALRSDMTAEALAQVVLSLLVGDVAQRFVSRQQAPAAEPALIERVMMLLSPRSA